jgi:hypothetical protein
MRTATSLEATTGSIGSFNVFSVFHPPKQNNIGKTHAQHVHLFSIGGLVISFLNTFGLIIRKKDN